MPLIDVIKLSQNSCEIPIQAKLKYATPKNFVGRIVDGYSEKCLKVAYMTETAAKNLCAVQNELVKNHGVGLLIYDSFRPKRAVRHFVFWSRQEMDDQDRLRKPKHYPNIDKNQMFDLGYVVDDSGHCYGNTVDVVLIDLATGKKLEMGSKYDYMDETSHIITDSSKIGDAAVNNRKILADAMVKYGFETYAEEYWHFSHGGKAGRELQNPFDIAISQLVQDELINLKNEYVALIEYINALIDMPSKKVFDLIQIDFKWEAIEKIRAKLPAIVDEQLKQCDPSSFQVDQSPRSAITSLDTNCERDKIPALSALHMDVALIGRLIANFDHANVTTEAATQSSQLRQ